MSTKKVADSPFLERLFWLISREAKGKPTVFAKKAGIPHSTFFGYVEGKVPSTDYLIRIRDVFGVNINWLLTGEGEPYIEGKEGLASEPGHIYNMPEPDVAGEEGKKRSQLNIVLDLATQVLTSDNLQAADALEKNIRYFAHAIRVEERLADLEAKFKKMEDFLKKIGLEEKGPDRESSNG